MDALDDLLASQASGKVGMSGDPLESLLSSRSMAPRIKSQIDNDAISQGARDFPREGVSGAVLSTVGGLVRGAGSIGATLLDAARGLGQSATDSTPADMRPQVTSGLRDMPRGPEMRSGMDNALSSVGANPDSLFYKGGKVTSEILGTMGVGGALAAPVRAAGGPLSNTIATALETGGFRAPGLSGVPGTALRMGAGAATGGASAGLVDPEIAPAGFVLGGLLPPAVQGAGVAGRFVGDKMRGMAEGLMQSAVKPTLAQLKSGDAEIATRVMLDQGLNPTKGGAEKLRGLIDKSDDAITSAIQNSGASVDKNAVLGRLSDTRGNFTMQAAPQGDLAAIQGVEDAFRAHPLYSGASIPVQDAQALKRGTYKVLQGKFGEQGSASTEAQKALARGLKEEIATAVPDVGPLNAQLSDLIKAHDVVERRALMEANKNPLGLTALAPHPGNFAMFLADRSALLKSLAARGINSMSQPTQKGLLALDNPLLVPYVRGGLLATEASP